MDSSSDSTSPNALESKNEPLELPASESNTIAKPEPLKAALSKPEKAEESGKDKNDSCATEVPMDINSVNRGLNSENGDGQCQLDTLISEKSTRNASGDEKAETNMHEDDTSKSLLGSRPIIDSDSNIKDIEDIKEETNVGEEIDDKQDDKGADQHSEPSGSDDDGSKGSGENRLGKNRKKNKAQHKITKQSFTGFFSNLNSNEENLSSSQQQHQHAFIHAIFSLILTTANEVSGIYAGLEQHLEGLDKKALKQLHGHVDKLKSAIKNCKAFAVKSHQAFEKILYKFDHSKLLKVRDASVQISKVHKDEALDLNLDGLLKSTIALVTQSITDKNIAAILHKFSTPEGLYTKMCSERNQQFIQFKNSLNEAAYCPNTRKIAVPKPLDYYDVFVAPFNMILGFSAWMQSNGSVFTECTDLQASFKKISSVFSKFDANYSENDRITLTRIITCSSRAGGETKPHIICLTSHGLLLYSIHKGVNSLKLEQYEKFKYCTVEYQGMRQLNASEARMQFFDYHVSTMGIKDEEELSKKQVKLISSVSNYQLQLTLKSLKHPLKLELSSYSDVIALTDIKSHHQSKKELKKNDIERVHSLVGRNLIFSSRLNSSSALGYMYIEIISGIGFDSKKSYTITGSNAFSHQYLPLMAQVEVEKEFGTKNISFNTFPVLLGNSKKLIVFEDSPGKGKCFEFLLDFNTRFEEMFEQEMTVKDLKDSASLKIRLTCFKITEHNSLSLEQPRGTITKTFKRTSKTLSNYDLNNPEDFKVCMFNFKVILQMIDDKCGENSDALYRAESADSKAISTVAKTMTSLFQFESIKNMSAAELASGLLTWINNQKMIKYSKIVDLLKELMSVGPRFDEIKAQFAERLPNEGILRMFQIFMLHLRFILTQPNKLTISDLTPAISSALITEIENKADFSIEQGLEASKDLIKMFLS